MCVSCSIKATSLFGTYAQNHPLKAAAGVYHGARSLSNSYTMGCPPVRGDNPRDLASTGGQMV